MDSDSRLEYKPTHRSDSSVEADYPQFVGIRFEYDDNHNGKIVIHYPTSLGKLPLSDPKDNRYLLLNLVKSLKLSKYSNDEDKTYDNVIKNINIDKYPLYSYLWIWDDFKSHGRLLFSEMTDSRSVSGRINWKKTFQGDSLIYNENVYYNDYVYFKKKTRENLLSEIYDYCVYKSLEMIFFLTNLSQNFIHPLYKRIEGRKNEYITCLKETIESTFDDEKKLRYGHMLNIVKAYSFDSLVNKNIVGVTGYAKVFEAEIDLMLGNVDDKTKYFPSATLCVDGKEEPLHRLQQDTINIGNEECFIIDSKFYEFGNMPAVESVEKQIVYGENIENNYAFQSDRIYNIFLIPRCFEDNGWDPDEVIKYYGHSYSSWKKNTKQYEMVLTYFIDLKFIIKNYRNGYNELLFEKLRKAATDQYNSIIDGKSI